MRVFALFKHLLDVREQEQRQTKEQERDRDPAIDLSSPELTPAPSPGVAERRWRCEAAPRASGNKAELKQRFLIRLEKVETKTISLVH